MTDDLKDLLRQARERWNTMTPDERREMMDAQARSYARAEAGFGSDQDEADYRAALQGEAKVREMAMQALSDLGQAQDAWEAQKAAEARADRLSALLKEAEEALGTWVFARKAAMENVTPETWRALAEAEADLVAARAALQGETD